VAGVCATIERAQSIRHNGSKEAKRAASLSPPDDFFVKSVPVWIRFVKASGGGACPAQRRSEAQFRELDGPALAQRAFTGRAHGDGERTVRDRDDRLPAASV
jgi:hypothetical protein